MKMQTRGDASQSSSARATSTGGGRIGSMPEAALIPEYGVIHLKGCLSERGQRELWETTKPRVTDPAGKATGFSGFSVSRKARAGRAERRDRAIDAFGALLFGACGEALV
jgi:hypothetical protein